MVVQRVYHVESSQDPPYPAEPWSEFKATLTTDGLVAMHTIESSGKLLMKTNQG